MYDFSVGFVMSLTHTCFYFRIIYKIRQLGFAEKQVCSRRDDMVNFYLGKRCQEYGKIKR